MISGIDRDLLARFQHSYVRLFNAELYDIANQERCPKHLINEHGTMGPVFAAQTAQ